MDFTTIESATLFMRLLTHTRSYTLEVCFTKADLELVVVVVDLRVRLLVLVVGLRRVKVTGTFLEKDKSCHFIVFISYMQAA